MGGAVTCGTAYNDMLRAGRGGRERCARGVGGRLEPCSRAVDAEWGALAIGVWCVVVVAVVARGVTGHVAAVTKVCMERLGADASFDAVAWCRSARFAEKTAKRVIASLDTTLPNAFRCIGSGGGRGLGRIGGFLP